MCNKTVGTSIFEKQTFSVIQVFQNSLQKKKVCIYNFQLNITIAKEKPNRPIIPQYAYTTSHISLSIVKYQSLFVCCYFDIL